MISAEIELGGQTYTLLSWNSGAVNANQNRIGPTLNWVLPDVDATEMTLVLSAGEQTSEYRLCYRSREARRVSRQLNV